MKHVFVSYARADARFAGVLRKRLRAARRKPWQDLRNLRGGDEWQAAIDEALRNAEALLVIMSPRARTSQYVTYEWAYALGAGIRVIPIIRKKTRLHPRLSTLQFIDFTKRPGTPWIELWEALPSRRSTALAEPEISARFSLLNGKPAMEDGYYVIDLFMKHAPRRTRAVTYEMHDETLTERKWTTAAAGTSFESRMWSTGDILITATIRVKSKKPLGIATTLYEALRRGHGTSPNEFVRRALHKIKQYRVR